MAMSNHWPHHGPGQFSGKGGYYPNKQQKSPAPPVCFVCQGPHFVVNCPSQQQQSHPPSGPPPAAVGYPVPVAPNHLPQSGQWINGQNGAVSNSYGPPQPVIVGNQYGPSFQNQQHGNSPTSYGPPVAAPPYQHYGNAPGPYNPPPSHATYQQYGPAPPVQNTNYHAPHLAGSANNSFQQPLPPNNVPLYQQQQNPYPSVTGSYHGTKGPAQNSQWDPSQPPSSHSASRYQQRHGFQHDRSIKRESVTPRLQSQPQQTSHTPRLGNKSNCIQLPPQSSNNKSEQQDMFPNHGTEGAADSISAGDPEMIAGHESDVAMSIESKAPSVQPSSRASTPFPQYHRRESAGDLSQRSGSFTAASIAVRRNSTDGDALINKEIHVKPKAKAVKNPGEKEEGELAQEDLKEQEFNWEYQKIFHSPAPFEFVALAQPLSAKYSETATPVPLLNEKDKKSVSRYARNDNLDEFMRPVRTQSQWSYLQEDPGFLDVTIDGPLIPLDEVPIWMAKRHGEDQQSERDLGVSEDGEDPSSRKRARSVNEEKNTENWTQDQSTAAHTNDDVPNKRIKHEMTDEDTLLVQMKDSGGTPGTPTLARAGSQSGDEYDVWAPQPGESAAEAESTEAILASLGVTGSPKPVRSQSISGGSVHGSAAGGSRYGSVVHSMSPAEFQAMGMPPHTKTGISGTKFSDSGSNGRKPSGSGAASQQNPPQGYTNGTPPQNNGFPQHGNTQQNYMPQGPGYPSFPQQGPSHHGPPLQNPPPQSFSQQGPPQTQNFPQHGAYQNGPPHSQYVDRYAPPNQYPNSAPPQYQQHYPNAPYRQNFVGHAISPQSNGPYPNQQFGPSSQNSLDNGMPPQFVPPYGNNSIHQQYSSQNYQDNGMPPQNHAPYDNTPYAPGPLNQWGPGIQIPPQNPALYGGPPQPFYNGGHSSGRSPSYANPHNVYPPGDNQYAPQQPGIYPQEGTPQHGLYPPFHNMAQGKPPRQDSGYMSARGSYSNENAPGAGQGKGGHDQAYPQLPKRHINGQTDGPSDEKSPTGDSTGPGDLSQTRAEDTASDDEQALSPISREILGKAVTSKKKPEPMRQPDDGGTARRKPKRPQPEVAPAYSRRW